MYPQQPEARFVSNATNQLLAYTYDTQMHNLQGQSTTAQLTILG